MVSVADTDDYDAVKLPDGTLFHPDAPAVRVLGQTGGNDGRK